MRDGRSNGILPVVCILLCGASTEARADSGRVLEGETLRSAALGREWAYTIYLPAGSESSERAYPVAYLLHGISGGHTDWVRNDDAAEIADELIGTGAIPPMILVMPDGGDSFWVDSDRETGFGPIERALVEDLIPHVDSTYPTIPDRRHRMIAGLSMGGFGALRIAFKRPELFASAAGLSPALRKRAEDFGFRSTAFGAPFDPARYDAQKPWAYLPGLVEKGPKAKLHVYLTIGDDDGFTDFLEGTMDLFLELRKAKIDAELRVTNGGHSSKVWANGLRRVLPFFADVVRGRR